METSKKAVITRREVLRGLVAASVGAIVPDSMSGTSEPVHRGLDFASVREYILEAVASGKATGVAVAIVQGGRIIWEEGFGWANREAHLKATAHIPFSLASITKPFTTTTLMTLVAEGRLSLNEPANKYLSHSKIEGPNGNPDGATLRRLGAHVGGLPSMFEHFFADEATKPPSPDMLLRDYGRLAYAPGSCYEYSNVGYVALGAAASNVTGIEFGTLIPALRELPTAPWRAFRGQGLAPNIEGSMMLASLLEPFGVRPRTIRLRPKSQGANGSTAKGYALADLKEAAQKTGVFP